MAMHLLSNCLWFPTRHEEAYSHNTRSFWERTGHPEAGTVVSTSKYVINIIYTVSTHKMRYFVGAQREIPNIPNFGGGGAGAREFTKNSFY